MHQGHDACITEYAQRFGYENYACPSRCPLDDGNNNNDGGNNDGGNHDGRNNDDGGD